MFRRLILAVAFLGQALADDDTTIIPVPTAISMATLPPPGGPPQVTATATASGMAPSVTGADGCPTVTSTRQLCSSCIRPLCIMLATASQVCGCPWPPPTAYLDFPCGQTSCAAGCETSYSTVAAQSACGTGVSGSSTITTTGPACPGPSETTTSVAVGGTTTTTLGVSGSATTTVPVISTNAARRRHAPFRFW